MAGEGSTWGRDNEYVQNFVGKCEGMSPLERTRRISDNNIIKVDLGDTCNIERVDLIRVAQGMLK
jgi:hypothetical protein